jgi:phosphatidylglycerol:prolipoprotein diacylglycerol transferase
MATIGVPREQWLEYLDRYRLDGAVRDLVQSKLYALVEAIQSGNNSAKEAIAIALEPRYPSQLFAAFGEGLFIFLVLFFMWRKSRKPGVIAATFISLYAVIRIIGEQFREPDLDIGFQLFNLTRGQWLSVGMLLIGLTLLLYWGRREAVRTPGWGKAASVRLHRK